MICDICTLWCSRTKEQLDNRLRNIRKHPGAEFNRCPKCGSVEWATTKSFIRTRERKRRWWEIWREPPTLG